MFAGPCSVERIAEEVEHAEQEPLRLQNDVEAPPDCDGHFKVEVRRRLVDRFEGNPATGRGSASTPRTRRSLGRLQTIPVLFAAVLDNGVSPVTWLAKAEAKSNASGLPAMVSWLIRQIRNPGHRTRPVPCGE